MVARSAFAKATARHGEWPRLPPWHRRRGALFSARLPEMRWPPPAAVVVCAAALVLVLSPAMAHAQRATINGVVLGPSGAPEPNITLIVTNSAGVDRRVVSDVMGTFVLGGLQPGPYRIRTDNDTFAPFSQDAIVLTAGQVFSMKIALSPRLPPAAAPTARAAVQGTVLGPDGVPAGNIALIITNAGGIDRRVVTGPNGAYVFGGLQPGTYRLRIEDAGPAARPFPATEIVFAPGERRQFDVRLQPLPPPPPAVTATPAAKPTPAPAAPQGRVATLPVAAPRDDDGDFSYPVPEVTAPGGEFEAWPNRWDFQFPRFQRYENNRRMPWVVGSPFDPYNQNGAKGDFPVLGSQSLFANLTLQLNSTINPRQVGAGDVAPTSQTFDNHNFVAGLELFRGATVFQPKSWAVRATVVGNMNGLRTGSESARGTTYGVEEAFVEKRLAVLNVAFDFVSVRAGMQNFNSDFRGYLFADNQLGVRLFGNAAGNRHQYNFAYFDMRERDAASQLHTFSSRQQRVFIANYYLQDFGAPGYTAMFNVHVSRDAKLSPDQLSPQQVTYAGFHGDGRWGAWSVSHAFYQAFGTDSNSAIVRQIVPGASPELNINAQMAAIELSRDADWLRYRFSAYYASGDDRSQPGTAKGFDTITDNPNLAGGQFMYWTQQKSAAALGGSPRTISEKFSLLPNLRSKFGDRANFVNPGLMLVNGGLDMRLSPALKLVTNASLLRFADATILRALAGANPGFEDASIGVDVGFGAKYRPLVNENMFLVFGYSMLLPQGGFKNAVASNGRLHSFVAALQLAY